MYFLRKASEFKDINLDKESRRLYGRLTWVDKCRLKRIIHKLESELFYNSSDIVTFDYIVSIALQSFIESRGYEVWTDSQYNLLHRTYIKLASKVNDKHESPKKYNQKDLEIAQKLSDDMMSSNEVVQDKSVLQTYEPFELKGTVKLNLKSSDNELFKTSTADIDLRDNTLDVTILEDVGNISDGYHTFNELYEYRKAYNACLFNEWFRANKYDVHKSLKHHEGDDCFGGGWFVVVAVTPFGQITNHYKMEDFDLFDIPEYETAKYPWDGHTPAEALERILKVAKLYGGSNEDSTEDK